MSGKVLKKKMTTTENSLKTRTAAFNKRKHCLKKKALELSTLCDIDACILCVGPDGEIDIWPPEKHKLESIISRYRSSGMEEERGQFGKNSSKFSSSLKNPSLDEMLDEFSEEELRDLREELLKKKEEKMKKGGKKQSNTISKEGEEQEGKREEESGNKSLVPYTSDVLSVSNTVEMLDDDNELYFDPTVLDETPSSSSDWDWDWNHQPQIIVGSSTESVYDDPSLMKFDDGMMIEERPVYGYETMNDILLMCQMGSEEQSPSLLPMFDYI